MGVTVKLHSRKKRSCLPRGPVLLNLERIFAPTYAGPLSHRSAHKKWCSTRLCECGAAANRGDLAALSLLAQPVSARGKLWPAARRLLWEAERDTVWSRAPHCLAGAPDSHAHQRSLPHSHSPWQTLIAHAFRLIRLPRASEMAEGTRVYIGGLDERVTDRDLQARESLISHGARAQTFLEPF